MANEKTVKKYVVPEVQAVLLAETDIMTTSDDFRDDEGELTPIIGFNNLNC